MSNIAIVVNCQGINRRAICQAMHLYSLQKSNSSTSRGMCIFGLKRSQSIMVCAGDDVMSGWPKPLLNHPNLQSPTRVENHLEQSRGHLGITHSSIDLHVSLPDCFPLLSEYQQLVHQSCGNSIRRSRHAVMTTVPILNMHRTKM